MNTRSIITLLAVVVLAASAAFGWGSIVRSYAAPSSYPNGLGYVLFSGSGRIIVDSNNTDHIYRMYQSNGSVYGSYAAPGSNPMGIGAGMISTTGYVWVADSTTDRIYRMGINTGSIYGSYAAPGTYPYGLGFRDSGSIYYVYHTDYTNEHMYRMNGTTGSIYASYDLNYAPRDIAYGGGYLWIATGSTVRMSNGTTGATISTLSTAASGSAMGVAYDPSGPYLWVSIAPSANRINVYELSGTGVTPSSLGRVKAVYR